MTDALLPAAPQPLEKESDGYFRKVSGESADPPCKLRSALKGLAAGVGLDRRGRGRRREGTRRVGVGRTVEKGGRKRIARDLEPRADGSRAGARRCICEPRVGGNLER